MKNIALALGQIEEIDGLIEDACFVGDDARLLAVRKALARVREYLAEAATADAARVPIAHYTPVTAEEVAQSDETWPLPPISAKEVGP